MRCWICGTWDLYSSSESLLLIAASTPLRYSRSFTFSVGPRVTIGRICTSPLSFTTRAMSVAKWMGAPSRRPPARPTVPALSRSLICFSASKADGGRKSCRARLARGVFRQCAVRADHHVGGVTNHADGAGAIVLFAGLLCLIGPLLFGHDVHWAHGSGW